MHRLLMCLFGWSLVAVAAPSLANAQQAPAQLRIGAGMVVDFAGEGDYDRPLRDDDLEATVGLRGHLDYDIARYVSLGGFLRVSWWEGDDIYEERNLLFELGPRIAGHYDWRDFRFYVAGMPGLLISKMNNDYDFIENPAVGFTMSIAPGVEYWFNSDIAVYTEFLGWVGHYFDHEYENSRGEADFSLNQVAFNFGVVFAP